MQPKEESKIFTAAAQTVELNVNGLATMAISVRGTYVGTLNFEGTINGHDYFNLDATPLPNSTVVALTTGVGQWLAIVSGLLAARVRCSAYTSGSPEVVLRAVENGGATGAVGAAGGGGTSDASAANQTTQITAEQAIQATLGATTGAAVITDVNGTIQQYLRGIVKLIIAKLGITTADGDNVTQGAIADAVVAGGATGSISAKLRRLTTDLAALLVRVIVTSVPMITRATFTITLASLANATARQSTMITNSSNYPAAIINLTLVSGAAAPTVGSVYEIYLLRSDGTQADDSAGASDAAITIENSQCIDTIVVTATAAKAFHKTIDTAPFGPLGTSWGIAVKNSSGQALSTTEGDHVKAYQYYQPSQA